MDDTSKYLIHAAITADGVVERSDVVGAIFGQTEGLLGDDLDLRDLQQSSKVGRIDVEIDSEGGQSFGHITIASSLDRVETAILAASLETITRVGPCRSEVRVTDIEDIREAKRREVVERAKELLADAFDESIMSSKEILEEVRESVRVENITEYEGLPAGPRVEDSDAIIVVEGRADVLTLLRYGVKNAIAVEGTNVPDAVADLSQERTVTAFFDGDRGGELILRELAQVGDVDYVAFAPEGQSVEDLTRHEVMSALRDKLPYDTLSSTDLPEGPPEDSGPRTPREGPWATTESSTAPSVDGAGDEPDERPPSADAEADGSGTAVGVRSRVDSQDDPHDATAESVDGATVENGSADAVSTATDEAATGAEVGGDGADAAAAEASDAAHVDGDADGDAAEADDVDGEAAEADDADGEAAEADDADGEERDTAGRGLETLRGHVRAVVGESSGQVRLLDDDLATLADEDAQAAFELLRDAETTPYAVVLDGELTQRILDVAAQRGVEHVVARSTGEFVKRPVDVRVRTADQLLESHAAPE